MTTEEILAKFDEKFFIPGKNALGYDVALLFPAKVEVRDFIKEALESYEKDYVKKDVAIEAAQSMMNQIRADLTAIADEGEYEDMRREVERYFNSGKE
jgi:hypothetical protein